ncbi:MAG TPA: hypothetical protein VMN60_12995 [Longimicrobiales bacterium]|nr:hypothetical protein [Longimicrobiales bacterium]
MIEPFMLSSLLQFDWLPQLTIVLAAAAIILILIAACGALACTASERSVMLILVFACVAPTQLHAMQEPSARTLNAKFTRLYGNDSIMINGPTALSPDGRWVVYGRQQDPRVQTLWIADTRTGSTHALLPPVGVDADPVWHPSGDRLFFLSDRTAPIPDLSFEVMTLSIDPATGRASSPARRVTLDRHVQELGLTADGRSIVYAKNVGPGQYSLHIIPSNGGTARLLAELDGIPSHLTWTADGAHVYFAMRPAATSEMRYVMRVSASGGTVEEIQRGTYRIQGISPGARHVVRKGRTVNQPGEAVELATIDGRVIGTVEVQADMVVRGFSPDGRSIMARVNNVAAPVRLMPVGGGSAQQLTDAREYDWPVGWSADASTVAITTTLNGHITIILARRDGGAARTIELPRGDRSGVRYAPSGAYVAFTESVAGTQLRRLSVMRVADAVTRVVTSRVFAPVDFLVTGPGGAPTNGNEFLYLESTGDRLEVRGVTGFAAPRLIASVSSELAGRTAFAVHGSRVAYTQLRGDTTHVMVLEHGAARRVAVVAGVPQGTIRTISFSHDGRRLALDHYTDTDGSYAVLVIDFNTSGQATQRVVPAGPLAGWSPQWLPDGRAVTVFGMTGSGVDNHIFLVPLDAGTRPVNLTRDDASGKWGYLLSPDGRHVAYAAEIARGASIWQIDLSTALPSQDTRPARNR